MVDQVVCMEPGCGVVFADVSQLQAHRKLSHCHVVCDVCGLSMLRRQLKMHILLHTGGAPRIQCPHPGCLHTYSSVWFLASFEHILASLWLEDCVVYMLL